MAANSQCTNLPDDIIIEILVWLSVESLSRFKSVCKQWLTIIESPSFVRKHFNHENNRTKLLVYWSGYPYPSDRSKMRSNLVHVFSLFRDSTLESYETPDHLKLPSPVHSIRGPCNGVFCVRTFHNKLALWNPATRRLRPLPRPPRKSVTNDEIGFGFDHLTNEIKIILIYNDDARTLTSSFAIYTLTNDSWRYFENEPLLELGDRVEINLGATTFSNGFVYWTKGIRKKYCCVVLAFDMHNEFFEEIEMPEIDRSSHGVLNLYNDDLLALFSFNEPYRYYGNIWVMKEKGCWTKLFSLTLPQVIHWPYAFWNDDEFLVFGDKKLMLYSAKSKTMRILKVDKRKVRPWLIWAFHYKESLTPLTNGHGTQDLDVQSALSREYFVS